AAAGAESAAEREMLNRDGDRQACRRATAQDQSPPDGCGALLRVEVAPIERAAGTWAADDPTAPPPGWGPSPYAAGSGVPSSVLSGTGGKRLSRLGKTSFVLGSVLLAVGVGTGIGAIVLDSDLDGACGEAPCHPENGGTVTGYYALATTASIGVIGGGVLGAAGAVIWATAAPGAPAAERAWIAPVLGPGAVGVRGDF
ncbi:MAG: hypothetical protein HY744_13065, partial [Deltaproteobacteria bacterium]|nr:hypothetical protein [Deltaproteobacteria bacterium]